MNKRPTMLDLRKHELSLGAMGSVSCTNCLKVWSWRINLEPTLEEYQGLDDQVLQRKAQDFITNYYWRLLHEIEAHFKEEHNHP